MRALAAAVMLAACVTSAPKSVSFSFLEGCWRSQHEILRWRLNADGAAVGRLQREEGWFCGPTDRVDGCSYVIRPDADVGWRFYEELSDDARTYRLTHWTRRGAMFAGEGHPLRPPPGSTLGIRVHGDTLTITRSGAETSVLFEGQRCLGL